MGHGNSISDTAKTMAIIQWFTPLEKCMAARDAWDDGRYVRFVVGPPKASWDLSLWITEADTLEDAIDTLINCQLPPFQRHLSVKVVFRSKVLSLTTRIFDIDMDDQDTFYVVASPLSGEEFDTLVSNLSKDFDEDKVRIAVNKYCIEGLIRQFLTPPPGQPPEILMIELRNALLEHDLRKFTTLFGRNIRLLSQLAPDLDYERYLRVRLAEEVRHMFKARVTVMIAFHKLLRLVPGAIHMDASVLLDILAQK